MPENDSGTIKYWFNGLPSEQIIPEAAAPPPAAIQYLTMMGIG
jgi:hypothetical protein